MTTIRDRLEKIDEDLLRLLGDRVSLCEEAQEDDPEFMGPESLGDMLAQWDAAADEHGWNPALTARLCKGVYELCKAAE
ncbi:MAG: hypothetical protein PHW10_03900 [Candidatus Peribacteraceae bacterium]|nr:hypothetical protein [Candidatus Peribacteraceae bacterium]